MPCSHIWAIEPVTGPISKAICRQCGARKEFRNYADSREADILAGNTREENQIMPPDAKPPVKSTPLPLEMTPNDLLITSFAYRINSEIAADGVIPDRIEITGDPEAVKILLTLCQQAKVVMTVRFR